MEMKTFNVRLRSSIDSMVQVEALNEDEAQDTAQSMTIDELMRDGNYVEVDPVITSCEQE